MNAWRDFKGGKWQDRIDVRDFIQKNYTPYTGDESFLQPPTARTEKMLEKYEALCRAEQQNGGVLNIDTETVITATSFGPGYLDKENEIIVRLQTEIRHLICPLIGQGILADHTRDQHHRQHQRDHLCKSDNKSYKSNHLYSCIQPYGECCRYKKDWRDCKKT